MREINIDDRKQKVFVYIVNPRCESTEDTINKVIADGWTFKQAVAINDSLMLFFERFE